MTSPANPMAEETTPALSPMYRLQYEAVQQSWVLLYPEGMVKLNGPASEILRRCDGRTCVRDIVASLEEAFGETGLGSDVCDFLRDAYERGWVT